VLRTGGSRPVGLMGSTSWSFGFTEQVLWGLRWCNAFA
jgi:hypothetical protein